jgi:ATP-binding protein involved in chromosome partitioning
MTFSIEAANAALNALTDDHNGQTLGQAKAVKNLRLDGDTVSLDVVLGYPCASTHALWVERIKAALAPLAPGMAVHATIKTEITAHSVQGGTQRIEGVKNIIAVASGKGGVGKSTTAVNLALALSAEGARVGVLDADIYGPSVPTMMGLVGKPEVVDGKYMKPMVNHGLQVISMGFLVRPDDAVIWRGPMATQALDQLLRQTKWDDLDYLIVDMPPGTGDIQLSLSQRVPLTGAVVVTTPQDIALIDARKGVRMFEKVSVPILGLIENMAVYCCPNCGHMEHIFGADGGQAMAQDMGLNYLGALPLNKGIREQADSGTPTVAVDANSDIAQLYRGVALKVAAQVAQKARDYSGKFPSIKVSSAT